LTINTIAIGAATSDGLSYVAGAHTATEGVTSALATANAINKSSTTTGVTATAQTTLTSAAASAFTAITAGDVLVNGVSIGAIADAGGSAAVRSSQMISAINAVSGTTGVKATSASATTYTLTAADGRNIDIMYGGASATAALTGITGLSATTAVTQYGQVTLSGGKDIVVTTPANPGHSGLTAGTTVATGTSLDISTSGGAQSAISSIDLALNTVDTIRGGLGAIQNRFESTIANLQNISENISSARSRILDADIAQETSNMTKQNILQQAGVSILAQANQQPQLALSLLK
jgi:flagellin